LDTNFQFLWGWNRKEPTNGRLEPNSFNSFEDETGNRRRRNTTIQVQLSIPLRMKPQGPPRRGGHWVESFQFLWGWNSKYIICSWTKRPYFIFQFLWGWNAEWEKKGRAVYIYPFQFLWGWNSIIRLDEDGNVHLSIPLRMKQKYGSPQIDSLLSSFNSFEDETRWYTTLNPNPSRAFNSFEDETRSRRAW